MGADMRSDRSVSDALLGVLSGGAGAALVARAREQGCEPLFDLQLRSEPKGTASWATLYNGMTALLNLRERRGRLQLTAHPLFLRDVQVPEPLRRRGSGSLLAADAILTLAPHGTAMFAHPGPTDVESEDPEDVRRLRSEAENTRFLAALGFVPFRDRLWVLDLSAGH